MTDPLRAELRELIDRMERREAILQWHIDVLHRVQAALALVPPPAPEGPGCILCGSKPSGLETELCDACVEQNNAAAGEARPPEGPQAGPCSCHAALTGVHAFGCKAQQPDPIGEHFPCECPCDCGGRYRGTAKLCMVCRVRASCIEMRAAPPRPEATTKEE